MLHVENVAHKILQIANVTQNSKNVSLSENIIKYK